MSERAELAFLVIGSFVIGLLIWAAPAIAGHHHRHHHHHRPKCFGHRATIVGPNDPTGEAPRHQKVTIGTHHHDVIVATRKADWVVGNGGSDLICTGPGKDYIFLGTGSTPRDGASKADAGKGDDYVAGTYKSDKIVLGSGEDLVDGEFGADHIEAGQGNDFIRAQDGNDGIFGEGGNDHVEASSGDDFVDGGNGNDSISTGGGNDTARGDGGRDSIHLLNGRDKGYGGDGDDFVGGFDGADLLQGGLGTDTCSGGHGVDRFIGCETKREKDGPPPGSPPYIHLPNIDNQPGAIRHLIGFRHHLRNQKVVQSLHQIGWIIARYRQLAHAAHHQVDDHLAAMLRNKVPAKRAALRNSIERNIVRQVQAGICDEIDRLRIDFHQAQGKS